MTRRIGSLAAFCMLFLLASSACTPESRVRWKPHSDDAGMGETADEHHHRLVGYEGQQKRGMIDDLDLLFLTERPSRLTRWHE